VQGDRDQLRPDRGYRDRFEAHKSSPKAKVRSQIPRFVREGVGRAGGGEGTSSDRSLRTPSKTEVKLRRDHRNRKVEA
jgi:hypothetical protein